MDQLAVAITSALWLGILTSISPCPMATNIAAISFLSRRLDNPRQVLFAGLLYTLGRMLTYIVLAALIVSSLMSVSGISLWLQTYMNKLMGPALILVGMVLLELINLPTIGSVSGERMKNRAESLGIWGAALLGIVFALTFCPISAALYFGSLLPLAVNSSSAVLLPSLYGIGTALPVSFFALLIAFGARSLGKAFDRLRLVELWARRITGAIFILAGIYYCLAYIFHVL